MDDFAFAFGLAVIVLGVYVSLHLLAHRYRQRLKARREGLLLAAFAWYTEASPENPVYLRYDGTLVTTIEAPHPGQQILWQHAVSLDGSHLSITLPVYGPTLGKAKTRGLVQVVVPDPGESV